MLPFAVPEALGAPLPPDAVADGGPNHVGQIDEYPGMRIEYDRLSNGKLAVGCIIIFKAKK